MDNAELDRHDFYFGPLHVEAFSVYGVDHIRIADGENGFVFGMTGPDERYAYMADVSVDPELQGLGLGTSLVRAFAAEVKHRGATELRALVSEPSIRTFQTAFGGRGLSFYVPRTEILVGGADQALEYVRDKPDVEAVVRLDQVNTRGW